VTQPADDPVIVIRRRFDAPRDLVYRIWTDPVYVAQWWGVDGATSTVHEFDLRPGGRWRIDMRTASGDVYANSGVYDEVSENERIVYTDDAGVFTVTFASAGGATDVTIHARFPSITIRDRILQSGMADGIGEGLDRLANLLQQIRRTP